MTTFGNSPKDNTGIPISSVYVPDTSGANLTALQGGPPSTDGNGQTSAPAAMSLANGADVVQGSTTDNSAINTVMGRLTAIRDLLNATIVISGTITETNSAAIKADLDVINSVLGAQSDAAWSGSGSGSEISILKKIVAELASTLSVSGTITANAGSNLNTSALALDTTLAKLTVAQSASLGSNVGSMVQGSVSTSPPTYVDGHINPLSITTAGALRTDASATTQPVSGTVSANASQSGSWTVQPGNSANTTPWLTTINQGGNSANVTGSNALKVDGSGTTQPVSGTINATQSGAWNLTNISGSVTLPTGAATAAKQPAIGTAGTASADVLSVQGVANMTPLKTDGSATTQPVSGTVNVNTLPSGSNTIGNVGLAAGSALVGGVELVDASGTNKASISSGGAVKVDGSAATQPISASTLPLPSGASTAAKQPAIGVAGTASADVLSVQGIASMTPLKTDGSGVIQPVSGTVNVNALPVGSNTIGSVGIVAGSALIGSIELTDGGGTNKASISAGGAIKTDSSTTTQPISAISLPLPSGAATSAKQPEIGVAGTASSDVLSVQGITSMTPLKVDGSAVTQPVSAVSLPLPSGASTVAKQPALGTAGTASSDVISIQGISGMTVIKTDGSGTTQPVSGTVTANMGTTNGLALDSTVAKLNIAQSAPLGSNTGPMVQGSVSTSSPTYTTGDINPVSMTTAGAVRVDATATTQPVSGTINAAQSGTWNVANVSGTVSLPTGAATSAKQPVPGTAGTASSDVLTVQGIASMTALKVDGSATTQPVSGTVTANAGSGLFNDASVGATSSAVPGSASYLAGNKSGNLVGLTLDTSGNLNVNVAAGGGGGSGGTSSNYGSAFPTTGTAIGASDGTNMQGLQVESSTNKNLRVALYNGGTEASITGSNALKVDGSATTQPITGSVTASGTVTANQGTANATPWNENLAQVGGSSLALGQTTMSASVPVTIANNQSALTVSQSTGSNLHAVLDSGSTTTVTQSTGSNLHTVIDSGAITATTNADTTIGGTTAPSKELLIAGKTNDGTPQYQPLPEGAGGRSVIIEGVAGGTAVPISGTVSANAAQSGTWNINNISGAISLPTGAAIASKQPAIGTAGTASNDVLSVQGVASMTPLKVDGSASTQPVSGTITVNGILVGQGSATSGENGMLTQGAVTSTAPTYTTAQTSPISLTTAGALRTDASATTQPISGTVSANASQTGTWNVTNVSGTVSLPTGAATSAKQPAIGIAGTASNDVLSIQGIASMTPLKTDASATTQPVSGTVTVAQATGSNLHAVLDSSSTTAVTQPTASNLNAQVVGAVASAGSNSGNPIKTAGVFNTTQPTVTTGQIVDIQTTARGAQIVATGTDTFNTTINTALPAGTNVIGHVIADSGSTTAVTSLPALVAGTNMIGHVIADSGSTTAVTSLPSIPAGANTIGAVTQASGPWTNNLTQIGGTTIVTGGTSGLVAVGGPVASGSSNADNPLKIGGAFNTTQPTVTNGQMIDAQMTARGAQIVSTGLDAFNVVINSITAALAQANQIPVSNAGPQGLLTIAGTLTANSDNNITFSGGSTVARRIRIQNESTGTIYWNADATASTGSPSLASPVSNAVMVEWINAQITTLHIWIPSGGTTSLNLTGGVKVTAWA